MSYQLQGVGGAVGQGAQREGGKHVGLDLKEMSHNVRHELWRGKYSLYVEARLSHNCQMYFAARQSEIKNLLSGRNSEESGDMVMGLYCSREGYKERSGKVRDAPPLTHI